jgi:hypothetical protein
VLYRSHMDATQTIGHYPHSDVHYADQLEQSDERHVERVGEEATDLLPARGVVFSIAIGAGLWALILGAGWLIFR